MALDIFLGSMILKENNNERILGYYQERGEWYRIQGDDKKEFIEKLIKALDEKKIKEITLNNKYIKYFNNLIPRPKILNENTYNELYNYMTSFKNVHIKKSNNSILTENYIDIDQ
ncbi:MAG: hypothetical protein KatS3mg002_1207 [Candidatus Woesearchaeota archaeon]|nr:MAG: hypothetical protein KatS3mg002_1207 [Candidatus Woesearchaeota archaeon]